MPLTKNYNYLPYKFSAYRNSAYSTVASTFTLLPFDTKSFDTGTNYSTVTSQFTAPVAGFYQFNATLLLAFATTRLFITFYKNGTEYNRGVDVQNGVGGVSHSVFVQLAAADSISVYYFCSAVGSISTGVSTQFTGHLVSAT